MAIKKITLHNVLPLPFAGAEDTDKIARSEVWLGDLTFDAGERYVIEAESGAGKSSLCSFIAGLRRDYTGEICFDGVDVRAYDRNRWGAIRRAEIALMPQDMRLFPELTAIENIELKNTLTRHFGRQKIIEMLDRLEIADKTHMPVRYLSIGQQQRVALIRTLCQPFSFVLLDEPASHLDARINGIAASLVMEEADKQGAGIIATSVGNPMLFDAVMHKISL